MGNRAKLAIILTAALAGACESKEVWKARYAEQANEHKAARDAQYKDRVADERITRNVRCMAAIEWQRAAIGRAGIGSPDLYLAHYRKQLEAALGDRVVPAADGAPALSKAAVDTYLAWARPHYIETEFTAGGDADGNGTRTLWEQRVAGVDFAHSCVQFAAEMGVGPLGSLKPYQRYPEMQRARDVLHTVLRSARDG